jgi:hypothetical protein
MRVAATGADIARLVNDRLVRQLFEQKGSGSAGAVPAGACCTRRLDERCRALPFTYQFRY